MNFRIIAHIILISIMTALLFNFLNENGITLISFSSGASEKLEFVEPININAEEAELLSSKGVNFIDIRSTAEYSAGHIPGAISLPFDFIDDAESTLSSYKKDTPFVIYGMKGNVEVLSRSSEKFFESGFRRIYLFPGGFEDWTLNNYKVSK